MYSTAFPAAVGAARRLGAAVDRSGEHRAAERVGIEAVAVAVNQQMALALPPAWRRRAHRSLQRQHAGALPASKSEESIAARDHHNVGGVESALDGVRGRNAARATERLDVDAGIRVRLSAPANPASRRWRCRGRRTAAEHEPRRHTTASPISWAARAAEDVANCGDRGQEHHVARCARAAACCGPGSSCVNSARPEVNDPVKSRLSTTCGARLSENSAGVTLSTATPKRRPARGVAALARRAARQSCSRRRRRRRRAATRRLLRGAGGTPRPNCSGSRPRRSRRATAAAALVAQQPVELAAAASDASAPARSSTASVASANSPIRSSAVRIVTAPAPPSRRYATSVRRSRTTSAAWSSSRGRRRSARTWRRGRARRGEERGCGRSG